jgi:uncharacterized protein YjbI with pentapeptide repeats
MGVSERVKPFAKWLWLLPVGAALVGVLWKVPEWQSNAYRAKIDTSALDVRDRFKLEEDLITAENNARATLAQIMGGTVLLLGLYFTWRNIRGSEEGRLTERFSKAVELLGSEKLDIRLGGIYALERVARDSQKDHWTVMEVLAAFVRERSPNLHDASCDPYQGLDTDVQVVLTVIARRRWWRHEANIQRIDLSHTRLQQANLSRANLHGVILEGADLRFAILVGANLKRAFLHSADLSEAELVTSDLSGASLADAVLTQADFTGVIMRGADLRRADLSRATGLSYEQVSAAIVDGTTRLPRGLEELWKKGRNQRNDH